VIKRVIHVRHIGHVPFIEGEYNYIDAISSKCNFDLEKATHDMNKKLTQWQGNYMDGVPNSWDLITRYSPEIAGQGAALTETQWRRGERRRTAFWRAAQTTLGASGAKPTRTCVPRAVNGTGQHDQPVFGDVEL